MNQYMSSLIVLVQQQIIWLHSSVQVYLLLQVAVYSCLVSVVRTSSAHVTEFNHLNVSDGSGSHRIISVFTSGAETIS